MAFAQEKKASPTKVNYLFYFIVFLTLFGPSPASGSTNKEGNTCFSNYKSSIFLVLAWRKVAAKFPARPKVVIHPCLLIIFFLTSSYQVGVHFNARACNGFCGNQLKAFGDTGSNSVFHIFLF